MLAAKEFTTEVLKHLGLATLENILAKDNKTELSKIKDVGQLSEYLIYGPEKDMSQTINSLLSQLTTLKALNLLSKRCNLASKCNAVNVMMTNLPVKGDSVTYLIRCLLQVRKFISMNYVSKRTLGLPQQKHSSLVN
jgi:hypothetical protein